MLIYLQFKLQVLFCNERGGVRLVIFLFYIIIIVVYKYSAPRAVKNAESVYSGDRGKMNIAAAQSGGPTCAINASLAGIFTEASKIRK